MNDLISRQDAKDAIDMALDHIDHVPPWVYDNLLNALNEVPSVKPTHSTPSNTLGALDCVSRQAAIDALIEWYGCKPNDIEAFGEIIEALPSAQPIIRCRDCKNFGGGTYCYERDGMWDENDFCSYAERKEQDDG